MPRPIRPVLVGGPRVEGDLVADQLAALLAATPEPEAAPAEDSEPAAEPEADDSEPKPL